MFGRSDNKTLGAGSRNDKPTHQQQLATLQELGILDGPDWRKVGVDRPMGFSGGGARLFTGTPSEKATSIDSQTQRAPSHRSNASTGSHEAVARNKPRTGIMNPDRTRTRRERNYVGGECAVCEEPLEHTLRGERILQFSCGHVSHEACFYEFMRDPESQYCPTCDAPLHLDTSRGGNVVDMDKMSGIMRSAGTASETRSHETPSSTRAWDDQTVRPASLASLGMKQAGHAAADRYGPSRHARNDSGATGVASGGSPETTQSGPARRHDYDVQAMETAPASPRALTRNPIPAPTVSVRSEFPSISRCKQQQTLTCLVTIEVPDCKWRPDPDDLQVAPPVPPSRADAAPGLRSGSPSHSGRRAPRFYPYESAHVLAEAMASLSRRVDDWHGLDFGRFGKLRLFGTLRVGKDRLSWQELECYLFAEMLICVKERRSLQPPRQAWDDEAGPRLSARCSLKGSILIKKHLRDVAETGAVDDQVLTLSLSVAELPQFHLRFQNRNQLKLWQQALVDLDAVECSPARSPDYDRADLSETDDDDWQRTPDSRRQLVSSQASSWGGARSATTAPTEYTNLARGPRLASVHIPVDVVVVVPVAASMQGVKINLVRDALRFMVHTLGERDRMGLVTFGSSGGGVPVVGMTTKAWPGWTSVLSSIKPVGPKSHRADVVEGANVAMDLLMGRKYNNPIATIMLISDASAADADSVDFVVSRAEAAKITIHSFGLGMTHKPDTMIELSTKTKASYTYVKDWMVLRECLAGCLGAMQTLSHQNAKLKLKLPEGSPAKFHKISGALQITKRATGRDAEASLGDLRFGDKRDILVQLVIMPDTASHDQLPPDPWDNIVSGLEALGSLADPDEQRAVSVEEAPLIQADLTWGDILRDGSVQHTRPCLLAIAMLPASAPSKRSWTNTPPIPPHPSIVLRRMELLTSDMLTRALTLVSRGQHERAHTLLNETRSILKGLGKGGLPPVPPGATPKPHPPALRPGTDASSTTAAAPDRKATPSPTHGGGIIANAIAANTRLAPAPAGIDATTVAALDAELESSLEWINHPAVFGRDSRKAVLQAIGVISSQRACTFRTPIEALWAGRVSGVKSLVDRSREWRDEGGGEGGIMEEA